MSLEEFPPTQDPWPLLLCFRRIWEESVFFFASVVGSPRKDSCWRGGFLIPVSISCLAIGLFRFSLSSRFGLSRSYVSRNFSLPSGWSSWLAHDCSFAYWSLNNRSVNPSLIRGTSRNISSLTFRLYLSSPLPSRASRAKGLSVLFIFSKNQPSVSRPFVGSFQSLISALICHFLSASRRVLYTSLPGSCRCRVRLSETGFARGTRLSPHTSIFETLL